MLCFNYLPIFNAATTIAIIIIVTTTILVLKAAVFAKEMTKSKAQERIFVFF